MRVTSLTSSPARASAARPRATRARPRRSAAVPMTSAPGERAVAELWRLAAEAVARARAPAADAAGAAALAAHALLEAHEIFVRRYTPHERPWFPFHKDRSEVTVNVALSDDDAHEGGQLIAIFGGAVRRVRRREGCATIHEG